VIDKMENEFNWALRAINDTNTRMAVIDVEFRKHSFRALFPPLSQRCRRVNFSHRT
jgi:hypothetical protein